MKQAIKRTIARFAPAKTESGLRILLYHAVEESDPSDRMSLKVPPDAFRAQMALLREAGYQVVPLMSPLDGADGDGTARVVITFDDGYASQLAAADILEEFGFPATLFVVPAFLDGRVRGEGYWERWGHFGWRELAALASRGFDIGAHSASHPERLTRCSSVEVEQEIAGAKRLLEQRLGRPVGSFSYPHGAYNAAVERSVQEAGYRLACTSVAGINRDPWRWFALRRTEIAGTDGLVEFQQKLQGKYDWVGPWHQWRAAHA